MREEECTRCNGTGWVTERRDDLEFARRCDCLTEDTFMKKAEQANIPLRFQTAELSRYYPDEKNPSQSKAKKTVEKFIAEYPANARGILLQGRTGVGKTRLLCTIATELIKKSPTLDIYYIDWNDLVREMRSGEGHATRDFTTIHQLITRLTEVDLLLFDELGASRISPWVYDNVYYLFNRRYNTNKATICATNFQDKPTDGTETLTARVGERIRSRLYEMTEIIEIKGSDLRRH